MSRHRTRRVTASCDACTWTAEGANAQAIGAQHADRRPGHVVTVVAHFTYGTADPATSGQESLAVDDRRELVVRCLRAHGAVLGVHPGYVCTRPHGHDPVTGHYDSRYGIAWEVGGRPGLGAVHAADDPDVPAIGDTDRPEPLVTPDGTPYL